MIETSLRQAIGTPDFYLAYQPIVELDTGRMVSVEALARWDHPKFGSIAPSEFIPIAEESGLIIAVGEWVLRQACQAMRGWMTQDPARAPMMMSVNVSRAELALGRMFVERVISILRETGLEPQRLQLEITEREIMREPKCSLEALRQFRLLGVKIAMDDFGTGTSSLACLRDYPLDTVKIDRSFLISLATSREVLALIHATLLLIDNLGMTSVAEGVEETSQLAVLQSLGCNYAQGYLFSRPVRAEQLIYALEGSAAARVTAVA
jgi:EAL domain-containing protein (putative c-di-GMP-specific phosphodiesterase class I)